MLLLCDTVGVSAVTCVLQKRTLMFRDTILPKVSQLVNASPKMIQQGTTKRPHEWHSFCQLQTPITLYPTGHPSPLPCMSPHHFTLLSLLRGIFLQALAWPVACPSVVSLLFSVAPSCLESSHLLGEHVIYGRASGEAPSEAALPGSP